MKITVAKFQKCGDVEEKTEYSLEHAPEDGNDKHVLVDLFVNLVGKGEITLAPDSFHTGDTNERKTTQRDHGTADGGEQGPVLPGDGGGVGVPRPHDPGAGREERRRGTEDDRSPGTEHPPAISVPVFGGNIVIPLGGIDGIGIGALLKRAGDGGGLKAAHADLDGKPFLNSARQPFGDVAIPPDGILVSRCEACGQTGRRYGEPCTHCSGIGVVPYEGGINATFQPLPTWPDDVP